MKQTAGKKQMNQIKELLQEYKLTQKEFAEVLGIPKRTVENWCEGKSSPSDYIIRLITFYLTQTKESE